MSVLKIKTGQVFSSILPYFKAEKMTVFTGLACLIIVDLLLLCIPRIIKRAVDDLTLYTIDATGLLIYSSYILGIGILIGIFRYLWRRCLLGMARLVEEKLRNRLFHHLQTLSPAYFDQIKTGDLMAHATNDILQIRMACGMGLVALNDAIVLGTAAIGFMIYINLKLTLMVLIPMPLIGLGSRFFFRQMHKRYQAIQKSFSDLTEAVRERFAGIRIIKAYNMAEFQNAGLEKISKNYINKNLKLARVIGIFFPMMMLLTNLSLAIVLIIGGRQTIFTTITPGDLVAFINYLGLLAWPMMAFGWVANLIQRGRASLERLDKILQTRPIIKNSPRAVFFQPVKSHIKIEKLGFAYKAGQNEVLKNIALEIQAGQTLGIIGPPGAGKTTLLNLIPRLYEAGKGSILINGSDIRKFEISSLRANISFMPQEPFLFNGTIEENISFKDPAVSKENLIKAAQDACLYNTIQTFPKGFKTLVGEKGVILSGGQKQRIILARALLKKAPVLLLDDPISQVDTLTGNAIINIIKKRAELQTIIIVSHRLAAIRFANQIIVLDQGIITETGSHDELLKFNGYYKEAYHLQEIADAI